MSRTRTVLAAAALWLAIVAGTSIAAWVVIDRAGREVYTTDAAGPPDLPPAAPPVGSSATGPAPATATTPASPAVPTATPSSTRPAPRPSSPAGTDPTPRPSTPLAATSPSNAPAAPPAGVSDSVTVTGGTLGVSCQGSTISLRYVTPRNGWSYEIDSGSRSIEVHFRRLGAEEESEVHASCSGGRPVFEQSSGGAPHSPQPAPGS